MSSLAEEKKRLRKEILALRKRLPLETRHILSKNIIEIFIKTTWFLKARTIFLYVSFGTEIDTRDLIGRALLGGKRVALPRTNLRQRILTFHRLYTLGELVPGPYGILEPPERNPVVHPEEADLVVVPGVAFDPQGGRLGYGGGFYDRLLSQTKAPRVALAFALQIVPRVPREPHDLRVDYLITEKGILSCKPSPNG